MECSIIITNYCIIIINTNYNYIIGVSYNYYFSNKGLLKECKKEENVAVTGGLLLLPILKEDFKNIVSSVTYLPSHLQAGTSVISIQSTLCNAPDLFKNISLAVLFGSNGNSCKISKQLDMCLYTYSSHYVDAGWAREIKIGTAVNAACHRFTSPGLGTCNMVHPQVPY